MFAGPYTRTMAEDALVGSLVPASRPQTSTAMSTRTYSVLSGNCANHFTLDSATASVTVGRGGSVVNPPVSSVLADKEVTQNYREVTQSYREVTQSYREVKQRYREVTQNYREVTQSYREVKQRYREVKQRATWR